MTSLLSRAKNQWAIKFQAYLVSIFEVQVLDNKKSKRINLYSTFGTCAVQP